MELNYNELANGIRFIKLSGVLDMVGSGQIEMKFTGYCAGEHPLVLVDLSEVSFVASIGIRLFMINAKSLASRKGKMALLNPTPDVMNVLEMTGVPSVIPIYSNLESAESVLLGA